MTNSIERFMQSQYFIKDNSIYKSLLNGKDPTVNRRILRNRKTFINALVKSLEINENSLSIDMDSRKFDLVVRELQEFLDEKQIKVLFKDLVGVGFFVKEGSQLFYIDSTNVEEFSTNLETIISLCFFYSYSYGTSISEKDSIIQYFDGSLLLYIDGQFKKVKEVDYSRVDRLYDKVLNFRKNGLGFFFSIPRHLETPISILNFSKSKKEEVKIETSRLNEEQVVNLLLEDGIDIFELTLEEVIKKETKEIKGIEDFSFYDENIILVDKGWNDEKIKRVKITSTDEIDKIIKSGFSQRIVETKGLTLIVLTRNSNLDNLKTYIDIKIENDQNFVKKVFPLYNQEIMFDLSDDEEDIQEYFFNKDFVIIDKNKNTYKSNGEIEIEKVKIIKDADDSVANKIGFKIFEIGTTGIFIYYNGFFNEFKENYFSLISTLEEKSLEQIEKTVEQETIKDLEPEETQIIGTQDSVSTFDDWMSPDSKEELPDSSKQIVSLDDLIPTSFSESSNFENQDFSENSKEASTIDFGILGDGLDQDLGSTTDSVIDKLL